MTEEKMTFYTCCLQELPRINVIDVRHIVRLSAVTPSGKMEKGLQVTSTTLMVSFIMLLSTSKSRSKG